MVLVAVFIEQAAFTIAFFGVKKMSFRQFDKREVMKR